MRVYSGVVWVVCDSEEEDVDGVGIHPLGEPRPCVTFPAATFAASLAAAALAAAALAAAALTAAALTAALATTFAASNAPHTVLTMQAYTRSN